MDSNIIDCDLMRPWLDGGRGALGFYRIGPPADPVKLELALQANVLAGITAYATTAVTGAREGSSKRARSGSTVSHSHTPTDSSVTIGMKGAS